MLMIALLLLIAAAVVYAFIPKPIEVETAEVSRGPMQVTVDEDGQTRVRNRYVISAPLAGRLQRIALEEGDALERGTTVLAVITPSDPTLLDPRARAEAEARMRQAQAAIQRIEALRLRAQANLQFAQTEHERLARAYETNAASRHELDLAATALRVAEQELRAEQFAMDMAQYELEQAQAALMWSTPSIESGGTGAAREEATPVGAAVRESFEIRSPIDGRVFRIMQKSEAIVQPGTPLLEVGNPNDLEIVIDVLSNDAVSIQPGASVSIERWGGSTPLAGRVRTIEPSGFTKISALGVEKQRVNVIIDFDPPASPTISFGDGYRVEGRIVTWESDDVARVPSSALFRSGEQWSVFVAEAGRATLRHVRLGHRNALEAEVLDGLHPGDTVIIHPSDRVKPGARIRPRMN